MLSEAPPGISRLLHPNKKPRPNSVKPIKPVIDATIILEKISETPQFVYVAIQTTEAFDKDTQ